MARKKKRDPMKAGLRDALKGVKLKKADPKAEQKPTFKKPPSQAAKLAAAKQARDAKAKTKASDAPVEYSYDDRVAWEQEVARVSGLAPKRKQRVAPKVEVKRDHAADEAARARLDALVGGAYRFDVREDPDDMQGLRVGSHESFLRELSALDLQVDASVDLHGLMPEVAKREVVRFVRGAKAKGDRIVRIVHGKGSGVLRDITMQALQGGAAQAVAAFRTAPRNKGGRGAIVVHLTLR